MSYVITDACVGVCSSECTSVCPVDAIHGPASAARGDEGALSSPRERRSSLQVYIDPELCICCAACEDQCGVQAIFDEFSLPSDKRWCRDENAEYFAR